MAQPNYPPFPSVSHPPSHNPGEQPTYTQPPLGYPPIPQQASFANAPPMTQPIYPPAPQPNYPPVLEQIYPPVSLSQPSYPPVPQSSHVAPPQGPQPQAQAQPSYTYTVPAVPPAPTPQPNHSAIARPMPVLGPQYCLPHIVDLAVVRKLMTLTDDFVVTDVNKNVMFKVKGKVFTLHDKRVLLDAAGNPVITLRQKILSAHSRWQVFRGGSKDPRDLIFTAKTSSIIQLKTKLNVYLANRTTEDVSDFKVEGSWSERSCVIYVGESTAIAAQMHKKETAESYFLGKDTFMVTVYPNIDYAFVVALIVILDAINSGDDI